MAQELKATFAVLATYEKQHPEFKTLKDIPAWKRVLTIQNLTRDIRQACAQIKKQHKATSKMGQSDKKPATKAFKPIDAAYLNLAKEMAHKFKLPEALVAAIIHTESNGKPQEVSPKGAMGLMQIMPDVVTDCKNDKKCRVESGILTKSPTDPKTNVAIGTWHLRRIIKQFEDPKKAIAGYNAGPGNVKKYGGIPPFTETRNYVKRVTQKIPHYQKLARNLSQLKHGNWDHSDK